MSKPRGTKEVWVSVGLTLNLGNYESARLDAGVSVPLDDGDLSYDDAFADAWSRTLAQISEQAKELKKKGV